MTINIDNIKKNHQKRCLIRSSDSIIDEKYSQIIEKANGSFTTIYNYDIQSQYNKIIQHSDLSNNQETILKLFVDKLIKVKETSKYDFVIILEEATDDEIVISKFDKKKMSYISIDKAGDLMLSKIDGIHDAPFFRDYQEIDVESLAYDFLK